MKIGWIVAIAVFLVACGAAEEPSATPEPGGGDRGGGGEPPARSAEAVGELLVGTWHYDLRYKTGDVVPCLRVFAADGTGYQYARDAGEIGKESFTWTVAGDGKSVRLAYGGDTEVDYEIRKIGETSLVMQAPTEHMLPEEHVRQ